MDAAKHVVKDSNQAYLITHPERGIYLGSAMGMGFWSKCDPVGQPSAVTFPSREEANQYMASWDGGTPPGIELVAVTPDDGQYASIQACVDAGLEGWIDSVTPVMNERPI